MWIGLLGPLAVRGGDELLVVRAPKQRAVLTALALRARQVVSFDELADAVWDGAPPPGARVTLRNYVWRLRVLLDPARDRIVTRDPGYMLEAADGEVDVLEFGVLCREGRAAAQEGAWPRAAEVLGQALALWRGAPLADVPSQVLQRDWVLLLERERLRARQWRIEAQLHVGAHREVLGELEQLAASHPLDERLHALRMLALYRAGQPADALATYQQARLVLIDELAVEPGDELKKLHQQILARDPALSLKQPPSLEQPRSPERPPPPDRPAAPVVVPRQLPAAVAHFAGRADELRLLADLAEQATGDGAGGGRVVISAAGGTAGVGKTALAVHFAHQVASRFPDGQLYADLRGFSPEAEPIPPPQVVRQFLDALGAGAVPADANAQGGLYRSLLAGKRMLIVLDNARDASQVRPLLPGSGGCLVVITSRSQLTGLAATEGARVLTLGLLTDDEARELLASRLGLERVRAEPEAVSELIRLCARLPLALAIAAARAAARPGYSPAALAAELRDASGPLDALDTGDPIGSVRAVFSWSYRLLTPPAASLFRCLALHPGPDISAPAAASLTGQSRPQTRRHLTELTQAHLITEYSPGRYAVHDLLRAYATERARAEDTEPVRRAAIHRALDHYLHTACAADRLLHPNREPIALPPPQPGTLPEQPADPDQAMAWFDAEHKVLMAAISQAAESGLSRHAWQLPWSLATYLDLRTYWEDLIGTQRTALAAATVLRDEPAQALVRAKLGFVYLLRGQYYEAGAHFAQALEQYRQLGDQAGEACVHLNVSFLLERQCRYAAAAREDKHSLRLFRAIGHRAGQARALNAAGWHLALLGELQEALTCCQQALALQRELGDRLDETNTWDSLGYIHDLLGQHGQAAACYQQALSLLGDGKGRHRQAIILDHLGDTYHHAGDSQAARDAWRQALAILDDLHDPEAEKVRAKLSGAPGHGGPEPSTPVLAPGSP